MPPGLALQWRGALRTWRGVAPTASIADPVAAAVAFLGRAQVSTGSGGYPLGYDLRKGWGAADAYATAMALRGLIAACVGTEQIGPAAGYLATQAKTLKHPLAVAAALEAFLDLEDQDRAGGRWEGVIGGLTSQLILSQDLAGTWTTKSEAPACTASALAAAALDRAIQRRPEARGERAVNQACEWALGKQKTNGYFYACTWSGSEAVNPLLSELCDTVEGLLRVGLSRDNKHYRMGAITTLRHLIRQMPSKGAMYGAWTSEWNHERYRDPGATMHLARLCRMATAVPGPEQSGLELAAVAETLAGRARSSQLDAGTLGEAEVAGGIPGALPLWGRSGPWMVGVVGTAELLR